MSAVATRDFDHCTELLRSSHRNHWLATLLMPEAMREATTILRAWHLEIAAISRLVAEPMAGEFRLQWWHDVLDGQRRDEADGNPVARALLALKETHDLPASVMQAKIDAHIFDLYRDPMGPRTMFEGYAGETRSALYQLVQLAVDPDNVKVHADASGHAGVVEAVLDVLIGLPAMLSANAVYLPRDLLAALGMDPQEFLVAEPQDRAPAISAFTDFGLEHLASARMALAEVPGSGQLAYLSLALAEPVLRKAAENPVAIQAKSISLNPLASQWKLWRAARSGKV